MFDEFRINCVWVFVRLTGKYCVVSVNAFLALAMVLGYWKSIVQILEVPFEKVSTSFPDFQL